MELAPGRYVGGKLLLLMFVAPKPLFGAFLFS